MKIEDVKVKNINEIRVWFFGRDKEDTDIYPMVMVGHRYHYRVTTASLKRLAIKVQRSKQVYSFHGYNGWGVDLQD